MNAAKEGNDLFNKKSYEEAIKKFDEALEDKKSKNQDRIHYCKGLAYHRLKKFSEAISCLENSIKLKKEAAYYCALGDAYESLEEYQKAIEKGYDEALKLQRKSEYYNKRGQCLFNNGDFEEAVASFNAAIDLDKLGEYYFNRGMALLILKRYDVSLDSFNEAIEKEPLEKYYQQKAIVLRNQGKYAESHGIFQILLAKNPGNADLHFNQGNTFVSENNLEGGIECYNEALSRDQDNALYLCRRGQIYSQLGKEKESMDDFKMAQKLIDLGNPRKHLSKANLEFIKKVLEFHKKVTEAENLLYNHGKSDMDERIFQQLQELKQLSRKGMDQQFMEKMLEEFSQLKKELVTMKKDFQNQLDKKFDNHTKIFNDKLTLLKIQNCKPFTDYHDGFHSTIAQIYTSSQAISSGKLSLETGEDTFSPGNLFIKLSSFVPFGIGDILSEGIEKVLSHLKETTIVNHAKYITDLSTNAVDLYDLIGDLIVEIISSEQQRKQIEEAKEEEQGTSGLIRKVKNFVIHQIEKLKSKAEEFSKIKNLFEKEFNRSPAFSLGEDDANKILKAWIEHVEIQLKLPSDQQDFQNKKKLFLDIIIISSEESLQQPEKKEEEEEENHNLIEISQRKKRICCEIF